MNANKVIPENFVVRLLWDIHLYKLILEFREVNFLNITVKNQIFRNDFLCINYNRCKTNNIKFSGIIFDKHLTFKHHVDVIAQKISKSVGILFKLSKYLPLDIIKTLYYSLINPFLLYGIEVWHGTYANITNKIFIFQKKACRAIHNLHAFQYSHNRIL